MMKHDYDTISIGELVEGYSDNGEGGVVGLDGKLNIRPAYQREFVYKPEQRDKVIDSVLQGYPLNSIYWVKNDDGSLEVLDGQQRTISICQFHAGDFSLPSNHTRFPDRSFHDLREAQKKFLDYELSVYICSGDENEKLEWFERVNTAGEKLNNQELLNAIFHGPWVSGAKKIFSGTTAIADDISDKYVKASAVRQEYLETALKWYAKYRRFESVRECMSKIRTTESSDKLWEFYQGVIDWIESLFPKGYYKKEMKGIDWGSLYAEFVSHPKDPERNKRIVDELLKRSRQGEITKTAGIFRYIFTMKKQDLQRRMFTADDRSTAYARQEGKCAECGQEKPIEEMEADHIKAWADGGMTTLDNCQMLCKDPCHRSKTRDMHHE